MLDYLDYIEKFLDDYGFPIFVCFVISYVIYYTYKRVIKDILPPLKDVIKHLDVVNDAASNLDHRIEILNRKIKLVEQLKNRD